MHICTATALGDAVWADFLRNTLAQVFAAAPTCPVVVDASLCQGYAGLALIAHTTDTGNVSSLLAPVLEGDAPHTITPELISGGGIGLLEGARPGPRWQRHPVRLENVRGGSPAHKALRRASYDLLIVGHEYPSLPAWRATADTLDCEVVTFQHSPDFLHHRSAFDGHRRRLYCYSAQMSELYRAHSPVQELAVHAGYDESEHESVPGEDLVWVGRIDQDKSPHLAIRAAQILGRRIRVVGPLFDSDYADRHQRLFSADHVDWVGELGGAAKTRAFRQARVLVYTQARDYVEAGAAIFGESLRAGTPIAALTWSQGTCVEAALCEHTGHQAIVDPSVDDEKAAQALASAIEHASVLPHRQVQQVGLERFDAQRHFHALAGTW